MWLVGYPEPYWFVRVSIIRLSLPVELPVALPMLHQRTEVHSYYMSHPYETLTPRARAIGLAHIVTQCFSFGITYTDNLLLPSHHVPEPSARRI